MNAPQRFPDFIRHDRPANWERMTPREFPRDDMRTAKWKAAEARTDEYLAWMCVIGIPIVLFALYYRIF